jgi:exodeoxyribonuclease III
MLHSEFLCSRRNETFLVRCLYCENLNELFLFKKIPYPVVRGVNLKDTTLCTIDSEQEHSSRSSIRMSAEQKTRLSIISWNINGWDEKRMWSHLERILKEKEPNALCLMETKCKEEVLRASIEKKCAALGYSQLIINAHSPSQFHGIAVLLRDSPTCTFVRTDPILICKPRSDNKTIDPASGRVITLDCDLHHCRIVFSYVPNAGTGLKHLDYRINEWNPAMSAYLSGSGKETIWIGDLNVVQSDLDMSHYSKMKSYAGCTEQERASHLKFLSDSKWVDIWRARNPKEKVYSWRGRGDPTRTDYGIRLDAAIVSPGLIPRVLDTWIAAGDPNPSDHTLIGIVIS